MSHLVIIRMNADRDAFERVAEANQDTLRSVSQAGKDAGAVHHAFYVGADGQTIVVDEWDSPESFQDFFAAEQERIGPLMAEAGVQGEPQIEFYEKVDTVDAF
jgi:hypothetical protein